MENIYQSFDDLPYGAQKIYTDLGERYTPESRKLWARAMGMHADRMDDAHIQRAMSYAFHSQGLTHKNYRTGRYGSPSRLRSRDMHWKKDEDDETNSRSSHWRNKDMHWKNKGMHWKKDEDDETCWNDKGMHWKDDDDDTSGTSEGARKGWATRRRESGEMSGTSEGAMKGWETRRRHASSTRSRSPSKFNYRIMS